VFGSNAGVAFQIQDDILDIIADEEKLGKPIGSDIRKGKKTLIMVHALNNSSAADRKKILSILGKKGAEKKKIDEVIAILEKTGSIGYAKDKVKKLSEESKKALLSLPSTQARSDLTTLSDYLMNRRF